MASESPVRPDDQVLRSHARRGRARCRGVGSRVRRSDLRRRPATADGKQSGRGVGRRTARRRPRGSVRRSGAVGDRANRSATVAARGAAARRARSRPRRRDSALRRGGGLAGDSHRRRRASRRSDVGSSPIRTIALSRCVRRRTLGRDRASSFDWNALADDRAMASRGESASYWRGACARQTCRGRSPRSLPTSSTCRPGSSPRPGSRITIECVLFRDAAGAGSTK